MVNLSSCVRVDMVLTEARRRKSVLAHETLCFFCGSVSRRREMWSTVSFLQFRCLTLPVWLRKWEQGLVPCTDGALLVLGCKWTRMGELIQSKKHLSFFNVAETQLGLWTQIWGAYSREILKSSELAFRKHFWCMSESWQGSAVSVYILVYKLMFQFEQFAMQFLSSISLKALNCSA